MGHLVGKDIFRQLGKKIDGLERYRISIPFFLGVSQSANQE